jgi:hypothetical protein
VKAKQTTEKKTQKKTTELMIANHTLSIVSYLAKVRFGQQSSCNAHAEH